MNCVIISRYPFPYGMAASNRILAYSKGLVENEIEVDVLIPIPLHSDSQCDKLQNSGRFQGINYHYTNGRYRHPYKIIRGLSVLSGFREISGLVYTCIKIFLLHKQKGLNCIIISTDKISSLLTYSIFANYLRIKTIFIFDEYPTPIRHRMKDKIPKFKRVMYSFALRKISGYISISEELFNFYNKIKKKKCLILSTIIDSTRFTDISSNDYNEEYICYMGNLELEKDNVDLIINAFKLIANKYPNLKLFLYGTPQNNVRKFLLEIIDRLEISDRVILKGQARYVDVPKILNNAKILVSSQPSTKRASGGFPTKLGEYLASGVPSILTNVGANAKYAINGEHVFFVNPHDVNDYSNTMLRILNNYRDSKVIGLNGKKYILENFSHTNAGLKIKEFINQSI